MVSRLAVSGALDGRAFHPRPVARRARHDRAYRAFRACPCRRRRARRGVAAAFPVACGSGHGACLCGVLAKYPVAPSIVFCVFSVRSRHRRGAFRAYMAELFRAGLQSVPRAQWEAGISLGLGVWNTLRLVILPQAVRRMLPPLTSQLVSLIKDTSLVSAIAVADLTMQAQVLIADTFLAFEIWLIVAALYLALTLCVALPARWMERRYAWR